MIEQSKNPLSGYFRQPAIYLKIPSLGRWWTAGSIDLPSNQEIPIYPMTARDEVAIRTPDALLNGQAVVDVIQSCCPNIKNAWHMPSVDTDAILISIRIATYGNRMEIKSKCSHCNTDNDHEVDLGNTLSSITCPEFDQITHYEDLKIKLKPQNYRSINKAAMITYEEQKLLGYLADEKMSDEEKLAEISKNMKRIADLGFDNLINCTEYIELPNGQRVTDPEYLIEFFNHAKNDLVTTIQTFLSKILEEHKIRPVELQCNNCNQQYSAELNFDFSNFFVKGF